MVIWGQGGSEPATLTDMLVRQSRTIAGLRCFVGIPADSAVTADTAGHLSVSSYCGSGSNAALYAAGMLEIVRLHYSQLPDALSSGDLAADVVLVQVSAPDAKGRHSLGLADDYFSAAIDTARVVIAEINDQVPFTFGARTITDADWTAAIHTSRPPAQMPSPAVDDLTQAVATRAAGLVPDGATLQFGIGALPEAVLAELGGRRELGIHSGIINDAAMRLMQAGVVTGARKSRDVGVAVGGLLGGTSELHAFADRNPDVEIRSTRYTHDPQVLATSHRLTAINSAIEVDLTGQVNSEMVGTRYVGALGGAVDFLTGAGRSPGGLPMVALPSTAKGRSRIVAELVSPISTPREVPVVVVTERGIADLRGTTLEQRIERMLLVADPFHRPALELAGEKILSTSSS